MPKPTPLGLILSNDWHKHSRHILESVSLYLHSSTSVVQYSHCLARYLAPMTTKTQLTALAANMMFTYNTASLLLHAYSSWAKGDNNLWRNNTLTTMWAANTPIEHLHIEILMGWKEK